MKKSKRIFTVLLLAALLISALCVPAFALTESEVETAVEASGKKAVTGSVFIWFLCAMAFLKISQKIDSIMAALGVNVARPGGSLLADAMIAARGVSMLIKAGGGAVGGFGRAAGGSSGGAAPGSPGNTGGFFKGGLIGMAGRHITNSAVKTATSQTAAVHTAQKQSSSAVTHTAGTIHSGGNTDSATPTAGATDMGGTGSVIPAGEHTSSESQSDTAVISDAMTQREGVIITGHESQSAVHSENSSQAPQPGSSTQTTHTSSPGERIHTQGGGTETSRTNTHTHTIRQTSIGGAAFVRSLASGGKFANDVIGTVASGDIRSTGSITGNLAAQSLCSYMGYTALGAGAQNIPNYSNVEIGGGRITGTETPAGGKEGLAFGMYHAAQYTAPEGPHEKVYSVDGTLWYKQYAQDSVERKPYKAPDGTVAYEERIVKKLPTPPKRKDRI